MTITDVRVKPIISKNSKLRAIASITIEEDFVVHDVKLIQNAADDFFIAMPSKKDKEGNYRDVAHPIKTSTREHIQAIIVQKYHEVMAAEAAMTADPELSA